MDSDYSYKLDNAANAELVKYLGWIVKLYRLGQKSNSESQDQEIFQQILEHVVSGFNADSGSLAFLTNNNQELKLVAGIDLPPDVIGSTVSVAKSRMGAVVQSAKPVLMNGDLSKKSQNENTSENKPNKGRVSSAMCWPLHCEEFGVMGALNINRGISSNAYTESDLEAGRTLVEMIGVVLENTRLHRDSSSQIEALERMNAEIKAVEARISSIIETAADGVISIDKNGKIDLFNSAAETIFGYAASDVLGKNVKVLMPDPYHSEHDGYLKSYLTTGESRILGTRGREVEGLRKDGTTFPMELTVSQMFINGETKFTGMIRDITERKLAQQKLSRNYEELKKVNENLKSAQDQLLQSEKMASVGQLAAGVAHEINNPVGYINSNVATLKQYITDLFDVLDAYSRLESTITNEEQLAEVNAVKEKVDLQYLREDIVELIGESQEGVTRVKQIVQDLKDFSHVDGGDWEWADLQKGLDSTINVARNELKYKAEVIKEYGNIPQIECMPSQLNQVFLNLLVNAAHAIETRGQITITTGEQDNEVYISITDTGSGMTEEVKKRIFEPFYTTKAVGTGTGLGLSLSYGIVEKHGGRIDLQSEVGEGTNFTVWLPIQQSENRATG